eukprot:5773143-Pleurochrysis_carterae.AAC.3
MDITIKVTFHLHYGGCGVSSSSADDGSVGGRVACGVRVGGGGDHDDDDDMMMMMNMIMMMMMMRVRVYYRVIRQVGDVVERHLTHGDVVLFNRRPARTCTRLHACVGGERVLRVYVSAKRVWRVYVSATL